MPEGRGGHDHRLPAALARRLGLARPARARLRREVGDDEQIIPESHPERLKLLRLERLAPAVLLVLFDGVPAVVHIEEPRQGVQFGVRLEPSAAAPVQPPR